MQIGARSGRDDPASTYVELWFWPGRGPSHDHPGFFTRIGPDQLTVGAGIMLMPPHLLLRYREHVDQPVRGRELAGILWRLQSAGAIVVGEQLRGVPKPFPQDHERAELLTRLGLYAARVEQIPSAIPEAVLGPVLPELLVSGFVRLAPIWRWLAELD